MKIGTYKKIAREKLAGQWGMNAGILFLSILLVGAVSQISSIVSNEQAQAVITNALEIFVLFAFSYSLYYVALYVLRGGRAEIGQLFVIFQKKYYVPILLLNVISTIVQIVIGLLVFIPLLIQGGFAMYFNLVVGRGASVSNSDTLLNSIGNGSFIVVLLVSIVVFFFVVAVVSGIFDFAAWLKFDFPDMSIMDCVKNGWRLLKDRFGKYILLQLSFIGWLILGFMALVIGLLFVIPYINVTNAAFYDQALKEKMDELAL